MNALPSQIDTQDGDVTILAGDCVARLKDVADASVDLVFADPPYNMQLGGQLLRPDQSKVDAVDDDWDQIGSFADYVAFTKAWLSEIKRVLKPTGTIVVIGSYHNIFRVGYILQDIGFWVLNDIIWIKNNPMPNFRGKRLANAHETMIWASQGKDASFTFNYEHSKAGNDDRQLRSDWNFPICSGNERIRGDDGAKAHSTQKPEVLLERVLNIASKPGDLVLDPFLGSGTTGAVSKRLNRRFIGLERDPEYLRVARERIAAVVPYDDDVTRRAIPKREAPRVAFRSIVEAGLLVPGAELFDAKRKHRAIVKPDGTIELDGKCLSIHKAGAAAMKAQSCNGWDYWHYEYDGKLHPVDVLRESVRWG